MGEAVLNYFIYNENIYETKDFEKKYKAINPSVYEVIRIKDGKALFLEEHYERFINSLKLSKSNLEIPISEIKESINKLTELNKISNYNVKIVFNNLNSNSINKYYFFIKTSYPTNEMYDEGIKTLTYSAIRENPHAKVINQSLRDNVNALLKEKDCYEALYINDKNEITEGSRSNTFFLKGKKVYTAPAKDVLLGVTRQRIIRLCRENGIEVIEMPIKLNEINKFDAVFMSGTSPKVLPIKYIDDIKYDTKYPLLLKIMKIYDDEINNYLKK